jgi:hypothetical protein
MKIGSIFILYLLLNNTAFPGTKVLEEGFRNPPNKARPRAYWCWVNGNFSLSRLSEELKDASDKSMGGLDIWDVAGWVDPNKVVPAGPPFMGKESVQAIAHAIREAGKYGIEIGLTISSSWNAGGSWVRAEHGAMGLFRSEKVLQGPATFKGTLPFPDLPASYNRERPMLRQKGDDGLPTFWKPVAVLAMPLQTDSTISDPGQIFDLSSQLDKSGNLTWQIPEGSWRIVRYVCAPTGQPLMRPSPNSNGLMIDHFSREAMDAHLQVFIEKLQSELGALDKTALKYLYTDSYEVNSAVWTPNLPEEFLKRHGYQLILWLPVLDGFIIINRELSERFLFDFRNTLSDLIIENHYGRGTEICHQIGLEFHAEAGGPGPPVHNCPFEALKSLGSLDAPRGEFWYEHPRGDEHMRELQIVKGPASSAHLYNQPVVEAEAFTSVWVWQEGPNDIKQALDRALCEGLTRFVYHTQPHLPPEGGMPGWIYNFGTLMGPTRAWWPLARGFNDYIGRCCFLLMQGHFVGDVLFYYGDEAPNFVDPKHIDPSLGFGYDYDVCNSDIILNRMDVKEGRIVLPHGQKYEILVLPDAVCMNPKVLDRIEQLVQKGMTLIGPKPSRSHSLAEWEKQDQKVRETADRLWGTITGKNSGENQVGAGKVIWGKSIRSVLQEKGIPPDIQVVGEKDPSVIDYIHRTTENAEIYFLRNTLKRPVELDCIFRVKNLMPEFWNPESEAMETVLLFSQEEAGTRVPIRLKGYAAVFVIFGEGTTKPITSVKWNGQQLFPLKKPPKNRFFSFHDGQMVFWQNGNYELSLSEKAKQKISISNLPEPVSLDGSWEIRFPHGWGAPQRVIFPELIDWAKSEDTGIRHFSGVAAYHKIFEIPEASLENMEVMLDLGSVEEIARIYVNGHEMGIRSFSPYQAIITDVVNPGKNYLIIEIANLMNNQLVGDATVPSPYKRTHSNITKGPNPWMTDWQEVPLKPSGLLGPVWIRFGKIVSQE